MKHSSFAACAAVALAVLAAMPAQAGPCSEQISELGRKLAQSPALGPVTTGALAGAGPTTATPSTQPTAPATAGTSSDNRVGGTGGTKEMNAASAQVATSPQDVRRQQEGLPTAGAVAAAGSNRSVETTPGQGGSRMPDDRASQAKMELEKARQLDQADDRACTASVERVRALVN